MKIKPCPFCGATSFEYKRDPNAINIDYWYIDHYDSCWMRGRTIFTDQEQIDCWNTRYTVSTSKYSVTEYIDIRKD
jgi:hypothetical protein